MIFHSVSVARLMRGLLPLFVIFSIGQSPTLVHADPVITLDQTISREHPDYYNNDARMTIGRDGNVYLASTGSVVEKPFILRVSRDGVTRIGHPAVHALMNATANAAGIIATANAHLSKVALVYDSDFNQVAKFTDILGSDIIGWDAPPHVEAGESGDFYVSDPHNKRIMRIDSAAKVVKSYSLPVPAYDFRVDDSNHLLFVSDCTGQLYCVGFDGVLKWQISSGVHRDDFGAWFGGFDIDNDDNLYWIDAVGDVVNKIGPDGKAAGTVKLAMAQLAPTDDHRILSMRIFGDEAIIKRLHPTEMFQRYSLSTGALKNVAETRREDLTVTYPSAVWHSGQTVPLAITFQAAVGAANPKWRIWGRPLYSPEYCELRRVDGAVQVPSDWAGLYLIKVSAEPQPQQNGDPLDYVVRGIVDVRTPGSKGTAVVMTPGSRYYWGRGETIPLTVILRAAPQDMPHVVTVQLAAGSRVLARRTVPVSVAANGRAQMTLTISKSLTQALSPGKYNLKIVAVGLTGDGQDIAVGPGMDNTPTVFRMEYGDGNMEFPTASFWEAPDVVATNLRLITRDDLDFFTDRLGVPWQNELEEVSWKCDPDSLKDINALTTRLADDAVGAPPELAAVDSTLLQDMASYSARGIHEMAILTNMDTMLPITDALGYKKDITRLTDALLPFPAFRGWCWGSNWWVYTQNGANAATSPEQKAAYSAALMTANQTGKWDPVLDTVSGYRFGYAVDAQATFNKDLQALAPSSRFKTASSGSYRNIWAYPPISFQNVDEVDLQGQFEQMFVPYWPAHSVDFYRRPGKMVWGHPEVYNDSGTGDQILPNLFDMTMRGVDGVGTAALIEMWKANGISEDSRDPYFGTRSIFRAFDKTIKCYGPWLRTLQSDDDVAIAISARPFAVDDWAAVGGRHFDRVSEAYTACMQAHHPASFVFVDDMTPESLTKYKAVLLVDQNYELEPMLATALARAKAAGAKIFYDGSCRPETVAGFTPLGISFTHYDTDYAPAGDDSAYIRFPQYIAADLPALRRALDTAAAPAAVVANPEVWASKRKALGATYVFVVNNTTPLLDPAQIWHTTLFVASRAPVVTDVGLGNTNGAVYDVFDMQRVTPRAGVVTADLRTLPARIYAILPAPIGSVALLGPAQVSPGKTFTWKAAVLSATGGSINATIPLRIRLIAENGDVIDERYAAAAADGASGEMTVPLTADGSVDLEAAELFSGKSARLIEPIQPASGATLSLTDFTAASVSSTARGAALPSQIEPASASFGPHLRDIAVMAGGRIATVNAMNWDQNFYGIDLATGHTLWRQKLGHYFTFAPQKFGDAYAVQGYDYQTAEGYHLYVGNPATGRPKQRFALYGLPRRLPQRFVAGLYYDHINNFAAPEGGKWIADAGDMGLAIWSSNGTLIWSQDWWKTDNRHAERLAVVDDHTLLALNGMLVTAYDAGTGQSLWQVNLAPLGEVSQVAVSKDGKTIAVLTTADGGTLFVLQGGKVTHAYPSGGDQVTVSPDGGHILTTLNKTLRTFSTTTGYEWQFSGDDLLRYAQFSPDGTKIVLASDNGTVDVLDNNGNVLAERDEGALSMPKWLPDGGLLLAGWMGKLTRLDDRLATRWTTHLQPTVRNDEAVPLEKDSTPTVRISSWENNGDSNADIENNLLTTVKPVIQFYVENTGDTPPSLMQSTQSTYSLFDGKPDPPAQPWVRWTDINNLGESLRPIFLLVDSYLHDMRVRGITFVEDPAHPETWIRDARLEYWDDDKEQWVFLQNILANAAVHSCSFPPVETSRLRICFAKLFESNLRLGEIVVHGDDLGPANRDMREKRSTAVLFDERVGDVTWGFINTVYPSMKISADDAYSGKRSLWVAGDVSMYPDLHAPYNDQIPGWYFPVFENPAPGQYRYLSFAWKALSDKATGVTLSVGVFPPYVSMSAGVAHPESDAKAIQLEPTVPKEWKVETVDLWKTLGQNTTITGFRIVTTGGPIGLDRIVLGRTLADLALPNVTATVPSAH